MKILNWIKKLRKIVKSYDNDQQCLINRIQKAEKTITDLHVDIGYKNRSSVITTGRYKNRDFVQTYEIDDFGNMVVLLNNENPKKLKLLQNIGAKMDNNKEYQLKVGKRYWTFYKHPVTCFTQVIEAVFKNDRVDNIRIAEGRVFKTRQEATKALEG